ncbi:hypothetical protein D8674_023256 [Pyrus ussuriensis x Pyrus communis]|uniref:Uncharacterized protein n=1 Tax=Pyrus ussuriensis x Pyrus communis TaxID=2448454 RepID=A0A5N5GN22_9ROSA|nr:hypothetical protein D8674_023256 [Pyrus ussuriensis x Pyrus communis]
MRMRISFSNGPICKSNGPVNNVSSRHSHSLLLNQGLGFKRPCQTLVLQRELALIAEALLQIPSPQLGLCSDYSAFERLQAWSKGGVWSDSYICLNFSIFRVVLCSVC